MKATYVSYHDTNAFSKLILDYLDGNPSLASFYDFRPDYEGIELAIKARSFQGNREVLKDVLASQYSKINTSSSVLNNIEKITAPNTYTITTGHQLNIFTGPLYFIFKIVSAIKLADDLKQRYPDYHFIPVYWMASEDHDFSEINHLHLKDKKIIWNRDQAGATGRISLQDFPPVLKEFQASLGLQEYTELLGNWAEEAYQNHDNLADATRYFVNKLFQDFGLVIIDPDSSELKSQFAPIIKKELLERCSEQLVNKVSDSLIKAGYKAQIHARNINLFYLSEGFRERIQYENGKYTVLNSALEFSTEELLTEVDSYPERFSPNVVLRPVYQETILPNIVYIGGGAEVAYWFQLKEVFKHYHTFFPVILLRNSALIVEQRGESLLKKLNFTPQDIFKSTENLVDKWLLENEQISASLEQERKMLAETFKLIKQKATQIDKTFDYSSGAAEERVRKIIDQFEHKLHKGLKKNNAINLGQIEVLKQLLYPNNQLQERYLNMAPFFIKYGPKFLSALYQTFDPLGNQFTILNTENEIHNV